MSESSDDVAGMAKVLEAANAALASASTVARKDPYSYTAAAAALAADGSIYTGVNVFHFTGGPCAEHVCFGAAAAHGAGPLTHIVCVAHRGRGVINPCGKCRQIMLDLFPEIRVVITVSGDATPEAGGVGGQELKVVGVRELLPWAYETTIGKQKP